MGLSMRIEESAILELSELEESSTTIVEDIEESGILFKYKLALKALAFSISVISF